MSKNFPLMLLQPSQVLRLAFGADEYLPPDAVTEADIAAAEERCIVPVIGRALYDRLLAGAYPELLAEYLAAPAALFTRALVQPRLDIRTDRCGTTSPRPDGAQSAGSEPLRCRLQSLRAEARTLLLRASRHLAAHRSEYPEYDPEQDILNRCRIHGNFVQTL